MSLKPLSAIMYYTLIEALRNRLAWLVLGVLVVGFGITEFVGEVAITETIQFQSGFLGAMLRLSAVFMVSLFVITSMVREFNDKGLELVLSLPIPRASYVLGKLLGFWSVAVLIAVLCSTLLLIYAPLSQVSLWGISLAFELLIVTAFSLLCIFTFSHVTLALSVVMAFYLLARTVSAIRLISESPLATNDLLSQRLIGWFFDGLAYLLPSLEHFTSSEWLIYHTGSWSSLAPLLIQTLVYIVLIAAAAMFDLYRKNL